MFSDFIENLSPIIIWLSLGGIFIMLELFYMAGIGFIFLGLGCLSTVTLTKYTSFLEETEYAKQIIMFLIFSISWALILWKPLKNILANDNSVNLSMIGQEVIIMEKPLKAHMIGRAKWSGTIFRAQLSEDLEPDFIAEIGNTLYIKKIQGNLLILSNSKQ